MIKAFVVFRKKRVMKRILCVDVIRKGNMIIKTCNEKEMDKYVQEK